MKTGRESATPVAPRLVSNSAFTAAVKSAGLEPAAGKEAVKDQYRTRINLKTKGAKFTGSIDLDATFAATEAQAHRWDYGLGIKFSKSSESAVWIEPHSGSSLGEVKTVLAKLDWLQAKLKTRPFQALRSLTDETRRLGIGPFFWLSAGSVGIRRGSREDKMLAQRGMGSPSFHLKI
jgi:hypothetical protein